MLHSEHGSWEGIHLRNAICLSCLMALGAQFPTVAQTAGEKSEVEHLAAEEAPELAVEVFRAPRGKDVRTPQYPRIRQEQGREGWVNVSMMIDPAGKPYEVVVSDSSGDPAFDKAAVKAIERSLFIPATLNGQSLDAGYQLKVQFELRGGGAGARPAFSTLYRKLNETVGSGDQTSASAALAELEALDVHSLYEDAHLNLARYLYFLKWGSEEQQLIAITRAIAYEDDQGYLPENLFRSALLTQFQLQVKLQHFGAALSTWGKLESLELDAQTRAACAGAVEKILQLQESDAAYEVSGEIGSQNSWFHTLLKSTFTIDLLSGRVAELKLRCDRHYVFFRYSPELRYQVNREFGACNLEVIGDPGSRIRLVQS